MLFRALIAFVALPGMVAILIPVVVETGLYRYSRNPMYVSVTLALLGWAAAFGSRGLLIYALVVAVAFHFRVVLGEEPWLSRTHGSQWEQYKSRVPRWLW
jgi:protein-S-isoprenylcysteine O-methyltransferase Ste14